MSACRRRAAPRAPLPFPAGPGWRGCRRAQHDGFRRAWLPLLTGFAEPVFYLFSIGIGLGALINDVTTDGGTRFRMRCSSPPPCSPRRR